jgi:hypothetical protein
MSEENNTSGQSANLNEAALPKPYDEFEVGEHKVPWFLWLFFILIVGWASISWIQFFGY